MHACTHARTHSLTHVCTHTHTLQITLIKADVKPPAEDGLWSVTSV